MKAGYSTYSKSPSCLDQYMTTSIIVVVYNTKIP